MVEPAVPVRLWRGPDGTTGLSRTIRTPSDALPVRASAPPCDPAISVLVVAYANPSSSLILRPTPKRSTAPRARVIKMPTSSVCRSPASARHLMQLVPPSDAESAACKGEKAGETPTERPAYI